MSNTINNSTEGATLNLVSTKNTISASTTCLPTAKEYREASQKAAFQFTGQWSDPKYQCPKCGGGMCRNETITLTSYPAQYMYQCDKCGHKEYQYM